MNLMFRILISSLLLILSLNSWGTEEETSVDYSSQYKETARISWKVGLSGNWHLQEPGVSLSQFPVMVELQLPIVSPHFRWLLQVGGGLMVKLKTDTVCDPSFVPDPPEPPFDTEFFQKNYERDFEQSTNRDTCFFKDRTFDKQFIPYFISQTGFQYGSDVYGTLQGGIILSTNGDIGWTGELLIGKKFGVEVSGGLRTTFINDSLYVGFVLYLGNVLKNWWVEQPI